MRASVLLELLAVATIGGAAMMRRPPLLHQQAASSAFPAGAMEGFARDVAAALQKDGLVEAPTAATASLSARATPPPFQWSAIPSNGPDNSSREPPSGITFLVAGPQKTGTSALWEYLLHHPQLQLNGLKELLHFNNNAGMENCSSGKKESYLGRFVDTDRGRQTGDFTATDISCVCCPLVVKDLLPRVKLIVLVRNPIQRALSRYDEQVNYQNGARFVPNSPVGLGHSFGEYVDANLPILEACLDEAAGNVTARAWCAHSDPILGNGLYEASLTHWMQSFPMENLLILSSERLAISPVDELRRVERHLGIASAAYPEDVADQKYNSGKKPGWTRQDHSVASHTTDPVTAKRLLKFYMPHQLLLETKYSQLMWYRGWP